MTSSSQSKPNCHICGASLAPKDSVCGKCGTRTDGSDTSWDAWSRASQSIDIPRHSIIVDDPFVGAILNDRFRVDKRLGSGGYGVVYSGTHLDTGRRVALKLLRPQAIEEQEIEARFRREGLVLCSLKNPHTVTTYEFAQTDDGTLYIAMELLEGQNLKYVVRREAPFKWQRALRIVAQICEALSEAHQNGIVHRDLKPANIYLINQPDNPEFVKVLDFGVAKIVQGEGLGEEHDTQLTAQGQTVGTMRYMSPEQIMGQPLDGRSDIYTLGVLTFRCLTGRMPFPKAKTAAALIMGQLRKVPPAPSAVTSKVSIPEPVDRLVLRMLAKKPDDRFPSTDAVRLACEQLLATGQWSDEDTAQTVPASSTAPSVLDQSPALERPEAEDASLIDVTDQIAAADITEASPVPDPDESMEFVHGLESITVTSLRPTSGRLWLWIAVFFVVLGGGAFIFFGF